MNDDRLTLEKLQAVCRKFEIIKQAGDRALAKQLGVDLAKGDILILPEREYLRLQASEIVADGFGLPDWIRPSVYLKEDGIIIRAGDIGRRSDHGTG